MAKGRRLHVVGAAIAALACAVPALAADGFATVEADEPRAFGYQVGDVVTRRLAVHVPDGLTLEADSLPRAGVRGKSIELRAARDETHAERGGRRHDIALEYQVFIAPSAARTLELPPFVLRFAAPAGEQRVRVDAWPVVVAPIAPPDASPRTGLGELRPDAPPPPIETRAARRRLTAYAVAAGLLLAYLVHVYVALPWWASRGRPFTRAARALPPGDARAAMRCVHEALNTAAGEVVFAQRLEDFLARQPRYASQAQALREFFERSQRMFFAGAEPAADTVAWLRGLCQRLSRLERGAA